VAKIRQMPCCVKGFMPLRQAVAVFPSGIYRIGWFSFFRKSPNPLFMSHHAQRIRIAETQDFEH
jgi:hypothetical protein